MSGGIVTAVLLNWRRPGNMQQIVDSLRIQPFVAEVIVWDNSGTCPKLDGAWVMGDGVNIGTYARFLVARLFGGEAICTQDDDYLVGNWPAIYDAWLRNRDRIVACQDEAHLEQHDKRSRWKTPQGVAHEVLLGWGSMFSRDLAVQAIKRYTAAHGEDAILMSKADRIFSILCEREHVVMPAAETRLGGAACGPGGPMATYRAPKHAENVAEARRRAMAILGG